MEQITNKEILEKLNQIQIEINILKEKIPKEEQLPDMKEQLEMGLKDMGEELDDEVLNQVKEGLEDIKAGRIIRVA